MRPTNRVSLRTRSRHSRAAPSTPSTPRARAAATPDIMKAAGLPTCCLVHQPDAALYEEHARRASRHADGLPSPGPDHPEDLAFAESRIRKETIAAEDILHDLGALSMMSSNWQAMGRVGEVIIRTWQTADKMKRQRGAARRRRPPQRQCARQALCHQIHHQPRDRPSRLEAHRLGREGQARRPRPLDARLLRREARLIIKGGAIAAALMGDPDASIPTPQPVHYRPMFRSHGRRCTAPPHLRL